MFKNSQSKIILKIVSGILMPALLLSASAFFAEGANAQSNASVKLSGLNGVAVIFALNGPYEEVSAKYDLHEVKYLYGGLNDLLPTYRAQVSPTAFALMANDSDINYVELDSKISVSKVITDDPYFTVDEFNEDRQWYLEKIKVSNAWEYGTGSSDIVVAIIDTGIHASHLELNDGRVKAGYDVVLDRTIPANSNSDRNGHGTAVAGVIGAIANNGMGVSGLAWDVSLMPIKALQDNGSGTVSNVATAIIWAADNGADIINLSLGGPGFGNDQTLNNAIIYAYKKGAVIVSAAGNDLADHGISLDSSPVYPVCADGGDNMVIGVVATDVNDQKASFSNYGTTCVDIAAPGKKILTTAFLPSDPSDNFLIYGSGTSLAAPLVSGVAALLKSNRPELTNVQIKNIILGTSDNIDHLNQLSCLDGSCNGFLGRGRLNAWSALSPRPLLDGDLVRRSRGGNIYLISGGRKRLVSDFVFAQRGYYSSMVILERADELQNFPTGDPVLPLPGTLVKSPNDQTVYYISQDMKHPVTYMVFQSRKLNFADVQVINKDELDDITTGEWYWPADGTMIIVENNPTVYIMEDEVKRPVTYFVFTQRRLSFASVLKVSQQEFSRIPNPPDVYWLSPLDGTLIKSESDPTVYLIQDGAIKAVSYEAFVERKFSFENVKVIPQVELKTIRPGPAL